MSVFGHSAGRAARVLKAFGLFLVVLSGTMLLSPSAARAVPSFARQTGLPCSQCHTNFPKLTPFGRQFKLLGYLLDAQQSKLPHVSAMGVFGFTRTDKDLPAPAPLHFKTNNNPALNQASLFYGGVIVPKYVGGFVQGTYDGVGDSYALDNVDIRFAHQGSIAGHDVVYGVTANNNPTVTDLWNTTPAWGFPFSSSGLAPQPTASTLIQGGLAQQVGGVTAYAMLDGKLYLEFGAYHTLSARLQQALGSNPTGQAQISSLAPYWRIAYQFNWASNYLSIGHFGLAAPTRPGRVTTSGADKTVDLGFDLQYQYLGDRNNFTLLSSFIYEHDSWDASKYLGNTSRSNGQLYAVNVAGSYLYDKTYGVTLAYFGTFGPADPTLFGTRTGSPNTQGYVAQVDWLPFNKNGGPKFWPMSNVKFSLQYTGYFEFDGAAHNYDGTGRNAWDNNTLFLQMWLAF